MQTNTRLESATPATTTAADRRRRHLSVYHRALRSAETPQQRAAVASRYRQLFNASVHPSALAATVTHLPEAHREANALVSTARDVDVDRECREASALVFTGPDADLDRECREASVTVAA